MPKLGPWICDTCHSPIANVRDGYVIWRAEAGTLPRDFRVIHQGRCDDKRFGNSHQLEDFLGVDGLSYLLSFLSLGPIALNGQMGNSRQVDSLDEFVDFVRRMQIPGYERFRQHVGDQELYDRLDGANEYFPYTQEELEVLQRDGVI